MSSGPDTSVPAVTGLILEVFRTNGALLAAGDRLVAGCGLTSARRQVPGALAAGPMPVARIARTMGLTRQGVQRTVNDLVRGGFVAFAENPHHRRARLVRMTEPGRAAYAAVTALELPWAEALTRDLDPAAIETAFRLLRESGARAAETARRIDHARG